MSVSLRGDVGCVSVVVSDGVCIVDGESVCLWWRKASVLVVRENLYVYLVQRGSIWE